MLLEKPYKVLVVDDNEDIIEILQISLESLYGDIITIETCSSGHDAKKLLDKNQYKILLSDIHMPGMKGDELLRYAYKLNQGTQVIVLTGDDSFTTAMSAFLDGAAGLIRKPFTEEELKYSVDVCINKLNYWHEILKRK